MDKLVLNGNTFVSGDEIIAIIGDSKILRGKIYLHPTSDSAFYICHDNRNMAGSNSPVLYGYKYSYLMYTHDTIQDTNQPGENYAIYHDVNFEIDSKIIGNVDNTLIRFLTFYGFEYKTILKLKNSVTSPYDSVKISDTQGFIELHCSERKKKVTIKLTRLIRKLVVKYNEVVLSNPKNVAGLPLTDEFIEKMHNRWMSAQPSCITHEIVKGQDILKGYTKSNYVEGGSTLQNSCMGDKFDYLKLYTENPKQISLIIFYTGTKVCGRTLLWNCDNGGIYHDRIYVGFDWLEHFMLDKLKSIGYKRICDKNKVSLSKLDFVSYPYMDSFYCVSFRNKSLHYDPNGERYKYELRSVNGYINQMDRFSFD
jgi:hypothetical protein